ncbi:hypothetical protein H0H93_016299, partial [Arthromyces matolae]
MVTVFNNDDKQAISRKLQNDINRRQNYGGEQSRLVQPLIQNKRSLMTLKGASISWSHPPVPPKNEVSSNSQISHHVWQREPETFSTPTIDGFRTTGEHTATASITPGRRVTNSSHSTLPNAPFLPSASRNANGNPAMRQREDDFVHVPPSSTLPEDTTNQRPFGKPLTESRNVANDEGSFTQSHPQNRGTTSRRRDGEFSSVASSYDPPQGSQSLVSQSPKDEKSPHRANPQSTNTTPTTTPLPFSTPRKSSTGDRSGAFHADAVQSSVTPPLSGETKKTAQASPSDRRGSVTNEPMIPYPAALAKNDMISRFNDVESDAISIRKKGMGWMSSFNKIFRGNRNSMSVSYKADVADQDIVIAIMGRVGSDGKRLFIDDAFSDNDSREDTSSPHTHFVSARDPGDPNRSIFLVYNTGPKDQKLNEAIRQIQSWLSETTKRKLSGFIYLEDCSTPSPVKFTRTALELLDQCVDRQNIVVATTGWDDATDVEPLEIRHRELIDQWRPFVDRGVSVLRLPASGKTSKDVFHTSWDIVKLIVTKNDEETPAVKRTAWRGAEKKADDKFLEDPRDTDIVIPVMGPTGAGKSTFINYVAGQMVTKVGHNLKSETAQLQHVILPHPTDKTRRVIIVDTPGFDDTYVADSEILRRIAVWLARSYSANMTLAGVIYLHEISQTRMLGTARKNLDMFYKLIGQDATKNVVLATTKWSDIPEDVGGRREDQLRDRHWTYLLKLGADLKRFRDTRESGWDIIQHIIDQARDSPTTDFVAIQNELVEVKKMLPETEAGQALLYTLEELLQNQRLASAQLRKDGNSSEVKAMMHDTDAKIRSTLSQINELSGNRLRSLLKRFPSSQMTSPNETSSLAGLTRDDTIVLCVTCHFDESCLYTDLTDGQAFRSDRSREKHKTKEPSHYIVTNPKSRRRRMVLVDTPGFDDYKLGDREILDKIVQWLKRLGDIKVVLPKVGRKPGQRRGGFKSIFSNLFKMHRKASMSSQQAVLHEFDAKNMPFRRLGPSGLRVPVFSLGGWLTLGGSLHGDPVKDIIKTAFDAGINMFDTAEAYAAGASELEMGRVIKELGLRRTDLVISTKLFWGLRTGPNDGGLSRKHIIEGTQECLKRLGMDYVDVLFAHRPDNTVPMEEIVRAFNYVINKGWAFYWATSEWSAMEIEEAYHVADKLNLIPPIAEQCQHSMFHRERPEKEYYPLYKKYGLGTTTFSSLAAGLLTGKYNNGIPEGSRWATVEMFKNRVPELQTEEGLEKIRKVRELTKLAEEGKMQSLKCAPNTYLTDESELQTTPAALALAWVAKNPNTST